MKMYDFISEVIATGFRKKEHKSRKVNRAANQSLEVVNMQYALLGDIHSSKDDLEKVLAHISEKAPNAKLIGTGDLYECTVSKKDITNT